ncbi:hypothetical protein Mal4_24770 [Maioricimonas rarisocia]|uniref:Uncharacterized protein n=1 Tax=Maioricimonas rarisocia TaxID=2528026 RepID=A0A517Z6T9_9PLAN|nr:hypothetical protein [Maioricimonas rarisocia]QDU38154.1 hypothetical protein Mal4_24770 [Maioricimonas rarisocia]
MHASRSRDRKLSRQPARHARRSSLRRGGTVRPAFRNRRPAPEPIRVPFDSPEPWFEPEGGPLRIRVESAGTGYVHAVTADQIRQRLDMLPARFRRQVEVVQLSRMTRKRALFARYGLQWGTAAYLYPVEETLVECYRRPPLPQQQIEAKMFGGRWRQKGNRWELVWTPQAVRDFYLHSVLIHEVGHIVDQRNVRSVERERFADWFAIEYGYKVWRRTQRRR